MPPVHLVLWGNPEVEYSEEGEIRMAWETAAAQHHFAVVRASNPEPSAFRMALTAAIQDPSSQIVYISCHGTEIGVSFGEETSPVPYSEIARWLACIELGSPEDPDHGIRTLVFGFCESMNTDIMLETLMPYWASSVIGFTGRPRASEVAQLVAGTVTNLADWVHDVMDEIGRDTTPPGPGETEWDALGKSFDRAADGAADDPARNLTDADRACVVIARRDPVTKVWRRISGTEVLRRRGPF